MWHARRALTNLPLGRNHAIRAQATPIQLRLQALREPRKLCCHLRFQIENDIKSPRDFMLLQHYVNLTSVSTGVFARQDFRDQLEVSAAHVNLGRTRQQTLTQVHLPELLAQPKYVDAQKG